MKRSKCTEEQILFAPKQVGAGQPRPGAAADVLAEATTTGRVWFQTVRLTGELTAARLTRLRGA